MSKQWPKIRYESSNIELSNNKAPLFPDNFNDRFYVNVADNPQYITTERDAPTVDLSWQIANMSKTDRDSIWSFWDTDLARGKYDFTLIDHRRRFLFDASWDQWRERWRKQRGGIHDLYLNINSDFGWTPPTWGCYFFNDGTLADHGLNTDYDLSLGADGQLDGFHRYKNFGYCLRMNDNAVSAPIAANATVDWEYQKGNTNISLCAQVRLGPIDDYLYCVGLEDSTTSVKLVGYQTDGTTTISFDWNNGTTTAAVYTVENLDYETWYDVCGTYNSNNNKTYLYIKESANYLNSWSESNNLLYNVSAITDNIIEYSGSTAFPTTTKWTTLNILEGESANIFFELPKFALIQNIMIIDDFISPLEFNNLRRLWHMFNRKSSKWPK